MKIHDPEIGLKQINITVRNPARYVTISVTKLDKQPATVVHNVSGKVYKYIKIDTKNLKDEDLDEAKIEFPVNKTWISENNIDKATITLNRYHKNKWDKLPTQKVSEDSDYIYYEAKTTGFSTFAITGEEIVIITTTIPTTTTVPITTTVPTTTTMIVPEILVEVVEGIPVWIIGLVIIVVVVIVAVIWKLKLFK